MKFGRLFAVLVITASLSINAGDKKDIPLPEAKFDPLNLMAKEMWAVVNGYAREHLSLQSAKRKNLIAGKPSEWIWSMAWHPSGDRFAYSSSNCVCIWDMKTNSKEKELAEPFAPVGSVAYNHDGTRLLSGSDDEFLRVWNTKTNKLLHRWRHGRAECYRAIFDKKGARIASAASAYKVCIWDAETHQAITAYQQEETRDLLWLDDNNIIVSTPQLGTALMCDIRDKSVLSLGHCEPARANHGVNQVACSSNDNQLLWFHGKDIVVWDRKAGKELKRIETTSSVFVYPTKSLQLSNDDQSILIASTLSILKSTLSIFDKESGQLREKMILVHENEGDAPYDVRAAQWSPDESNIIVATKNGLVYHLQQPDLLGYLLPSDQA